MSGFGPDEMSRLSSPHVQRGFEYPFQASDMAFRISSVQESIGHLDTSQQMSLVSELLEGRERISPSAQSTVLFNTVGPYLESRNLTRAETGSLDDITPDVVDDWRTERPPSESADEVGGYLETWRDSDTSEGLTDSGVEDVDVVGEGERSLGALLFEELGEMDAEVVGEVAEVAGEAAEVVDSSIRGYLQDAVRGGGYVVGDVRSFFRGLFGQTDRRRGSRDVRDDDIELHSSDWGRPEEFARQMYEDLSPEGGGVAFIDVPDPIEVRIEATVGPENITQYERIPVTESESVSTEYNVKDWSMEELQKESYYGGSYGQNLAKGEIRKRGLETFTGKARERVSQEFESQGDVDALTIEEGRFEDVEDVSSSVFEDGNVFDAADVRDKTPGDFQEGLFLPIENPDNPIDYQEAFDPQDYQREGWESKQSGDTDDTGLVYQGWIDEHGDWDRGLESAGTLEGGSLDTGVGGQGAAPSGLMPESQVQIGDIFSRVIERGQEREAVRAGSGRLRSGFIREADTADPAWREKLRIGFEREMSQGPGSEVMPPFESFMQAEISRLPDTKAWEFQLAEFRFMDQYSELAEHLAPVKRAATEEYHRWQDIRRDNRRRWRRDTDDLFISDSALLEQAQKPRVRTEQPVATPPQQLQVTPEELGHEVLPLKIRQEQAARLESPEWSLESFRQRVLDEEAGVGEFSSETSVTNRSELLRSSVAGDILNEMIEGRVSENVGLFITDNLFAAARDSGFDFTFEERGAKVLSGERASALESAGVQVPTDAIERSENLRAFVREFDVELSDEDWGVAWHQTDVRDFQRSRSTRVDWNLAHVRDVTQSDVNVLQWVERPVISQQREAFAGKFTAEGMAVGLWVEQGGVARLGGVSPLEDWRAVQGAERRQAISLGVERGRSDVLGGEDLARLREDVQGGAAEMRAAESAQEAHNVDLEIMKTQHAGARRMVEDPALADIREQEKADLKRKSERFRTMTENEREKIRLDSDTEDVRLLDLLTPQARRRNIWDLGSDRTYGLEIELITDLNRAEMLGEFDEQISQGLGIVHDESIQTARADVAIEQHVEGRGLQGVVREEAAEYEAYRSQYTGERGSEIVSRGDFETRYGHELVFPVMQGQAGLDLIGETFERLESLETELNTSMGMHIHVGSADLSNYELTGVWGAFAARENVIDLMHEPSRRGGGSDYAESLLSHASLSRVKGAQDIARETGVTGRERFLDRSGFGDKYQKLNLRGFEHQTIEYRQPAPTLELGEAAQHIGFITEFVDKYAGASFEQAVDVGTSLDEGFSGLDLVFEQPSRPGQLMLDLDIELHSFDGFGSFFDDVKMRGREISEGIGNWASSFLPQKASKYALDPNKLWSQIHDWEEDSNVFYRIVFAEEDSLSHRALDFKQDQKIVGDALREWNKVDPELQDTRFSEEKMYFEQWKEAPDESPFVTFGDNLLGLSDVDELYTRFQEGYVPKSSSEGVVTLDKDVFVEQFIDQSKSSDTVYDYQVGDVERSEKKLLREGLYGTNTWSDLANYFSFDLTDPKWKRGESWMGQSDRPYVRVFRGEKTSHGREFISDYDPYNEEVFKPFEILGDFRFSDVKKARRSYYKDQRRREAVELHSSDDAEKRLDEVIQESDKDPNVYYRAVDPSKELDTLTHKSFSASEEVETPGVYATRTYRDMLNLGFWGTGYPDLGGSELRILKGDDLSTVGQMHPDEAIIRPSELLHKIPSEVEGVGDVSVAFAKERLGIREGNILLSDVELHSDDASRYHEAARMGVHLEDPPEALAAQGWGLGAESVAESPSSTVTLRLDIESRVDLEGVVESTLEVKDQPLDIEDVPSEFDESSMYEEVPANLFDESLVPDEVPSDLFDESPVLDDILLESEDVSSNFFEESLVNVDPFGIRDAPLAITGEKYPPTASQQRALEHTYGPAVVMAGPGSGKSRTLIERLKHLSRENLATPDDVLTLVFGKKAETELTQRSREIGGDWNIKTIDAFALSVVKENFGELGYSAAPDISMGTFEGFLRGRRNRFRDWGITGERVPEDLIKNWVEGYETTRKGFVGGREDYSDLGEPLQRAVHEFRRGKLESNKLDFTDALSQAGYLLESNPELRTRYREEFPFVQVDEFQDVSPTQSRLLGQLSPNLWAVGDLDQSVMSFRGGGGEAMGEMIRQGAALYNIEENFRSTPEIVGAAQGFIDDNLGRMEISQASIKPSGEDVSIVNVPTSQRSGQVISRIADEIREGEETAILTGTLRERDTLRSRVGTELGERGWEAEDIEGLLSFETLHASKGREWQNVILPVNLLDRRTGSGRDVTLPTRHAKTASDFAEQERLFYVGMTRAQERLTIMGEPYHPYVQKVAGVLGEQRASRAEDFLGDTPALGEVTRGALEALDTERTQRGVKESVLSLGDRLRSFFGGGSRSRTRGDTDVELHSSDDSLTSDYVYGFLSSEDRQQIGLSRSAFGALEVRESVDILKDFYPEAESVSEAFQRGQKIHEGLSEVDAETNLFFRAKHRDEDIFSARSVDASLTGIYSVWEKGVSEDIDRGWQSVSEDFDLPSDAFVDKEGLIRREGVFSGNLPQAKVYLESSVPGWRGREQGGTQFVMFEGERLKGARELLWGSDEYVVKPGELHYSIDRGDLEGIPDAPAELFADAPRRRYLSEERPFGSDVELHSLLSPFDEDVLLDYRRGEGQSGISRLRRGMSEASGERAWGGVTQQISDILQNTALIQSGASSAVAGVHLAAGIDVQPGSFIRSGMQAGLALGANLLDRRYGSKGVLPDEITDIDALASDLGDLDIPDHAGFYLKKVFEKSGAGTARWGQGSLSETLSGYSGSDLEGMFGESGSTLLLAQAEQARRFGQRSHQTQRDFSETVLGLFSGDFARSRRHVYDPERGDVSQEVSQRFTLDRILERVAPDWHDRRQELRQDPSGGMLDKVFGPLQPEDAQPHIGYIIQPGARGIGRFFGRFHAEPPESRQWVKNWSLENIVRGASRSETGLLGRWASDIGERKAFRAERSEMLAERRGTGSLYEWQDPEHFHSRIAERMGISTGEDVAFGTQRLGDPNSRFGRYFSRLPEKAKYPLAGLAGTAGAKIGYHYLFDSDDEEPLRLEDPAGYSLSPRYPLFGIAQRSLPWRRMRARGEQGLDDMFGEDSFHGEMLKSIVFGKKGNLPKDVKDTFVESGRVDALVQSGMHISMFTGLLRRFPALMIPSAVSALKDVVAPPEEEVVDASQAWYSKYQLKEDPWLPRWNPAWAGKKWHDDYDPDFEPPAWAWWDTNASRSRFDDWKPQPPSRGLETGETGVQDVLPWTVYSMFGVLLEGISAHSQQGEIRSEHELGVARRSKVAEEHLSGEQDSQASESALRVNINLADVSELDRLPGIGKRTAERILEYRESDDGFQSIEELLEVRGIGEKTLESIKPFVGLGEEDEETGYRIDGFEFDVQKSPFKGFNPWLDPVPEGSVVSEALAWQSPHAAPVSEYHTSPLFERANEMGVEKLPENYLDSVVRISASGLSSGTGFFVDDDVIATNYHVIEDMRGLDEGEEGFWTNFSSVYMGTGEDRREIPIRSILGVDPANDIALLQVDPVEGVMPLNVVGGAPEIDQMNPFPPPVVRSLGYPRAQGEAPQLDLAFYAPVSSDAPTSETKIDFEFDSTRVYKGESGSPLFDSADNVFGIVWGRTKASELEEGAGYIGLGTSGQDVLRLMEAVETSGRRDFDEDEFSSDRDVVSFESSAIEDESASGLSVELSANFFEKIVGRFGGDGSSSDSDVELRPETDIQAILQGLRAVREDPNLKEEAWEGDLALETGYLYKLMNLETGDPYIGLSKNHPLETGGRIRQHLSGRGSKEIAKVLPEFDASDFSAEVWSIGDLGYRELGYLEQVMIARTGSLEGGYNKTIGGEINEFVDFDKDFARSPDATPDIDYDRFESAEIALALPPEMFEEEDYFTEDEESQLRRFLAARFAKQPESTGRRAQVRRDTPEIEYTPVVPVEDRIDIQDASEILLQEVPGFHKGLAERSVDYQDEFGDFQTLEALGEMRGMSKKRLAESAQYLKPIVSTGGASVFPGVEPVERDARPPDLLDVETATASEFAALPGIGKVVGERIVSDREARGAFMTPQGIGRVRGVSDDTLEKVSPYLKGFDVSTHPSVDFQGLLPNQTGRYMGDPEVQGVLGPEGTGKLYDYNLANRPGFARSERVRGLGEVMASRPLESYHDRPGSADPYLDVDTATWEEFEDLPGVGESLARRIVSHRETEGAFGDYRGLSQVPGVSTGLTGSWQQYFEPFSSVSGLSPSSLQDLPVSGTVLDFQIGSETPWDIDINQATLDDWQAVPGVSRGTAHDILMHRGARGDFRDVDDLQARVGLSRPVYEMLLPRQDIDLNQASAMQLSFLPGIGQERAERIVGDRERFGEFDSFEDLGRVEGIGESLLDRLGGYRQQPVSRGSGGFEREFTPYPTDIGGHIPMYEDGADRDPAAPLFDSTNIEEVPLESGFQYSLDKFRKREGIGDFPSDKARQRDEKYGRRRTLSEIPITEAFSYFAEDELSEVSSDLFSGFVRGGEINAEVERRLAKLELNQAELEREIQQDRTLTVSERTEALGQLEEQFAPRRERLEGYEVSTSDVVADTAERAGASIIDRTLSFAADKAIDKAAGTSAWAATKAFGSKALSGLQPLAPALAPIALVAATVAIGERSLDAGYEEVIESQEEREQAFYQQVAGERPAREKELPEGFKLEDFLTDRLVTLISRRLRLQNTRGMTRG